MILDFHDYDGMPSEVFDDHGLKINIVKFGYIACMKADISPIREKDVRDIHIISSYLGVDPNSILTEYKTTEPPSMNLFGGKK